MKALCFLLAAVLVSGTSEVMEGNSSYSCCQSPTMEFDQRCENTWSINDKPISHSKGLTTECTSPCKEIEGGRMTLDSCIDLNVAVVCTNEMGVTQEKRIHYYGQPCSGSVSYKAGNQGLVGLLLLALVIGGFFV